MKVGSILRCKVSEFPLMRESLYKVFKIHYTKPLIQIVKMNGLAAIKTQQWFDKEMFSLMPEEYRFHPGDTVRVKDTRRVHAGFCGDTKVQIIGYYREDYIKDIYKVTGRNTSAWMYHDDLELVKLLNLPAWF